MDVITSQEIDAEHNNHLRLLASEIVSKLYQAREVMQLKLIQAAVDRALEMIVEERTRNGQTAADREGHRQVP